MATTSVRFTTPPELKRWSRGMKNGHKYLYAAGLLHWQAATDVMFDRSQQYVHVITGKLKASGTARVRVVPQGVAGEIQYGGPSAPYAGYELARGGEHDYLSRAVEASERTFGQTLNAIFEDAMGRAR